VAVGEEEVHWRKRLVAFTVASSPTITGWAKMTHGDVVKAPRHVAQGCGGANSGEPIQSDRDTSGYGCQSKITVEVHPRGDISYLSVLSNCVGHESPWQARIRAHGSSAARFSGLGYFSVLYHWKPNSERLTARVATPRAWISVQEHANPSITNL
jgi:hypothetical protein